MGQRGLEDHGALALQSVCADHILLIRFESRLPMQQNMEKHPSHTSNPPDVTATLPCYSTRLIPFYDHPLRQHRDTKSILFLPTSKAQQPLQLFLPFRSAFDFAGPSLSRHPRRIALSLSRSVMNIATFILRAFLLLGSRRLFYSCIIHSVLVDLYCVF